jgi:uncharacterized protein DUF6134
MKSHFAPQHTVTKLAVLLLLSCLTLASHAAPYDNLNFRVWLDDREIGQHIFTVTEQDGLLSVLSRATYNVKVLFVNVFKYQHEAKETWLGNCLTKLQSFTVENGKETVVDGYKEGDLFVVQRNDQVDTENESCVGTYAYWDPNRLQRAALMNSQTGELAAAAVSNLGDQPLPRLKQPAQAYRIDTEEASIQLWYTNEGDWLALETETNGRQLVYLNESLL